MRKDHLLSIPFAEWSGRLSILKGPSFRADQVRQWVFGAYEYDFKNMSNLPVAFARGAEERFTLRSLHIADRQISRDGTVKWALQTHDGRLIECVMIPDGKRRSICISSQVGCAMGCRFCNTAKMGFIRNLSLGEILEQFLIVSRYLQELEKRGITNVIFMGMGEPLNNLDTVAEACRTISSPEGFGLSRRKITVSTVGIVPLILEWGKKAPDFKLAISLNASNNTTRSELMPVNRKYPMEDLLKTADLYVQLTGQRLTFEYILIEGKTCTDEAADELKQIASKRPCRINLIRFNDGESAEYRAPSESCIRAFQERLADDRFVLLMRKPRGRDIAAACGQLIQQNKKVA